MSHLLKDIYSQTFYSNLASVMGDVLEHFDGKYFSELIFDDTWKQKELKDRMRHTSTVLKTFLSEDFEKATLEIVEIIDLWNGRNFKNAGLEFMFFPEYIEANGLEDFEIATSAMKRITTATSCEFAVRPFIIKYEKEMMAKMLTWSEDENHHVRRLASEGSRPRLPWAIALPKFKKDPKPILPILENLKQDVSEYVRRSVANNLNDIAKDNAQIVVEMANAWNNLSKETDAIIKHGSRTLLKQGHAEILAYYGLNNDKSIVVSAFKIGSHSVALEKELSFEFEIENASKNAQLIRLEYAIYFLRQNGKYGKKVFKISEKIFENGAKSLIRKKHSFRYITTRKYYLGEQHLSIIVNGHEREKISFLLEE